MDKIDLIIAALECAIEDKFFNLSKYEKALAAARELKALKPMAWAVERKVATCNEKYAELWRSNGEKVTPLYALEKSE